MNTTERNDEAVKGLLSGQGQSIPLFKVFMPESVMEPLRQVLFSGYIGEGPRAEEFERLLGPWFGNSNVLTLNNGTSALHLALRLAGVGPIGSTPSGPRTEAHSPSTWKRSASRSRRSMPETTCIRRSRTRAAPFPAWMSLLPSRCLSQSGGG
jgi:hypothetical protein